MQNANSAKQSTKSSLFITSKFCVTNVLEVSVLKSEYLYCYKSDKSGIEHPYY